MLCIDILTNCLHSLAIVIDCCADCVHRTVNLPVLQPASPHSCPGSCPGWRSPRWSDPCPPSAVRRRWAVEGILRGGPRPASAAPAAEVCGARRQRELTRDWVTLIDLITKHQSKLTRLTFTGQNTSRWHAEIKLFRSRYATVNQVQSVKIKQLKLFHCYCWASKLICICNFSHGFFMNVFVRWLNVCVSTASSCVIILFPC